MKDVKKRRSVSGHHNSLKNVHAVVLGKDGVGKSGMILSRYIQNNKLDTHILMAHIRFNIASLKCINFIIYDTKDSVQTMRKFLHW